jgi:7-carboxy-7-deazaguanine synthase
MNAVATGAVEAAAPRLKIAEIFTSIQGEAAHVGWPTVFVRLTGCPLRCVWCDTAYAFQGGAWMELDGIFESVAEAGVRHVCVTGGEPLAQRPCLALLSGLCDAGYIVSLETSGALDVSEVDSRVHKVIDIKTPGSGECERNRLDNLDHLGPHDALKFVLADRADFDWARDFISERSLAGRCETLFSPVWGALPAAQLADWILAERVPARLQLQMHKVLWGDEPGR